MKLVSGIIEILYRICFKRQKAGLQEETVREHAQVIFSFRERSTSWFYSYYTYAMNTKFGTIPHDSSFSDLILQHWDDFAARLLLEGQRNVIIDGHQLDISNVVAIAR